MDAVKAHPNVRRVQPLPRGWVLYEYHDALFRDPDYLREGVWVRKMQERPELRAARIRLLNEERSLLAPWYAFKNGQHGDVDFIAISEICEYRMYSLTPLRMIEFQPSSGWGGANAFAVTLETESAFESELPQLLDQWELASGGRIRVVGESKKRNHVLQFRAECSDYSGHWLMALWALLCDMGTKTSVSKIIASAELPASL